MFIQVFDSWRFATFRSGVVGGVMLEIELKYDLFREVLLKAHYYPVYPT